MIIFSMHFIMLKKGIQNHAEEKTPQNMTSMDHYQQS